MLSLLRIRWIPRKKSTASTRGLTAPFVLRRSTTALDRPTDRRTQPHKLASPSLGPSRCRCYRFALRPASAADVLVKSVCQVDRTRTRHSWPRRPARAGDRASPGDINAWNPSSLWYSWAAASHTPDWTAVRCVPERFCRVIITKRRSLGRIANSRPLLTDPTGTAFGCTAITTAPQ